MAITHLTMHSYCILPEKRSSQVCWLRLCLLKPAFSSLPCRVCLLVGISRVSISKECLFGG